MGPAWASGSHLPLMMLVFKIPFAASRSIQSRARATMQNRNQREKRVLAYTGRGGNGAIANSFFFNFPPTLLRNNWQTQLYIFKVYNMVIWCTYTLWMITKTVNDYQDRDNEYVHHLTVNSFCMCVIRMPTFEVFNIISLTGVTTMWYVTSSELILFF